MLLSTRLGPGQREDVVEKKLCSASKMSGRKRTQNSTGVEKQRVRVIELSAADIWGLVRVGGRGNRAPRLEDKRGEWQRTWLTFQGAEGELSLLTKSAGGD